MTTSLQLLNTVVSDPYSAKLPWADCVPQRRSLLQPYGFCRFREEVSAPCYWSLPSVGYWRFGKENIGTIATWASLTPKNTVGFSMIILPRISSRIFLNASWPCVINKTSSIGLSYDQLLHLRFGSICEAHPVQCNESLDLITACNTRAYLQIS